MLCDILSQVKVQRRKTDATKGPAIKMKADFTEKDFALHMTGFCKVICECCILRNHLRKSN